MTAFEFFVIYCVTCSPVSQIDGAILIILITGFLLLNVYISYILNLVAEQYKNKYEIDAVKKQNQLQLIHYEELNKKYIETQCMIHDIEKHISAIENLKNNENIYETHNYTKYIRQEIKKYKPVFNCSNKILSVILSQKIIEAESENITVKTDVEDLSLEFIESADITSIFANLWDNAIEGCRNSETNEKIIIFKMRRFGNFLYVDMSNSFNGKLQRKNGKIISSKKNHKGMGLISIQMSAKKYGGFIVSEQEGKNFLSEVVIPVI
jgi:sensor histidine kinase